MRPTLQLTKSMDECLKLYRLMCFNVFAHNRDDHSKNFTYIYDETIAEAFHDCYLNKEMAQPASKFIVEVVVSHL